MACSHVLLLFLQLQNDLSVNAENAPLHGMVTFEWANGNAVNVFSHLKLV